MGPPESVQTIFITYHQHRQEIFANLELLYIPEEVQSDKNIYFFEPFWRSAQIVMNLAGEVKWVLLRVCKQYLSHCIIRKEWSDTELKL